MLMEAYQSQFTGKEIEIKRFIPDHSVSEQFNWSSVPSLSHIVLNLWTSLFVDTGPLNITWQHPSLSTYHRLSQLTCGFWYTNNRNL